MILGEYPAHIYAIVAATSGILSILICQYLAVALGHQLPFPNAYITQTASHYPQFIFFRIGTISGSVFIIMAHFANYFWLQTIAHQSVLRINKYYPKISLVLGIMGALFLFVSTACIDTGRTFKDLHNECATGFFVTTILCCFYNTYVCYKVQSKTKKIGKLSMYLKYSFIIAFIIQFYIGSTAGVFDDLPHYMLKDSNLSHILEYTLAFTILAYFYTMAYDLKGFKFVYENKQ